MSWALHEARPIIPPSQTLLIYGVTYVSEEWESAQALAQDLSKFIAY